MQMTDVQFKIPLKRTAHRAKAKLLSVSFITCGKKGEKHNSSGFPLFLIFFFLFADVMSTVVMTCRLCNRSPKCSSRLGSARRQSATLNDLRRL